MRVERGGRAFNAMVPSLLALLLFRPSGECSAQAVPADSAVRLAMLEHHTRIFMATGDVGRLVPARARVDSQVIAPGVVTYRIFTGLTTTPAGEADAVMALVRSRLFKTSGFRETELVGAAHALELQVRDSASAIAVASILAQLVRPTGGRPILPGTTTVSGAHERLIRAWELRLRSLRAGTDGGDHTYGKDGGAGLHYVRVPLLRLVNERTGAETLFAFVFAADGTLLTWNLHGPEYFPVE